MPTIVSVMGTNAALRAKIVVKENATFTKKYYAAEKRYIGNTFQVFFKDGTASKRVACRGLRDAISQLVMA